MHLEERRRQTYLIGLAVGLPVIITVWFIRQAENPYVLWVYPSLALYLAWALWSLLYRRQSLVLLERVTLWVVVSFWLGRMIYELHSHAELVEGWQSLTPSVYMGLILLSVIDFVVLPTRSGLFASLGTLAASGAIGLSRILPEALTGTGGAILVELIRYEVSLAVIISFLYVLSRSKDDFVALQLEAQRMKTFAYQDSLTGLPNRRHLTDELAHQWEITQRYERPLALIAFDMDHFKIVNDSYGHGVGDQVLCAVADLVRPLVRTSDIFGRWGGEEFMIILPETDQEQAKALAERIRQSIEGHTFPHQLKVTASFGVVMCLPGMTSEMLLEEVDKLLYAAKEAGRNRWASA